MGSIILQKGNILLQINTESGTMVVYAWQAIVLLCVAAAIALALYLLMGFGLLIMAKNNGVKHGWLGFLPFLRYFIAGRIAGATRVFGKKMKNPGFWLAIISLILFVCGAVNLYLRYYPLGYAFFKGDVVEFIPVETGGYIYTSACLKDFAYYPYEQTYMQVWTWLSLPFQLAEIFFFVLTFMQLFRKFNPRNYFTFILISFFGEILGISLASLIVFTQRNKKAVNYNDYLKEQYMRMQGMYAPPRETPPDNPFREFGARGENDPGDPFAEFGEQKQNPSDDGSEKDDKKEKKNDPPDHGDSSPFEGF